jgi:hypothetical protein
MCFFFAICNRILDNGTKPLFRPLTLQCTTTRLTNWWYYYTKDAYNGHPSASGVIRTDLSTCSSKSYFNCTWAPMEDEMYHTLSYNHRSIERLLQVQDVLPKSTWETIRKSLLQLSDRTDSSLIPPFKIIPGNIVPSELKLTCEC